MNKVVYIVGDIQGLEEIVRSFGNFTTIQGASNISRIEEDIYSHNSDILLYCESDKNVYELFRSIKSNNKNIRIVFMPGTLDMNDDSDKHLVSNLIRLGIFDIYTSPTIKKSVLREALNTPKKYEEVAQYVLEEDEEIEIFDGGAKNVVIFSSIKPGSGKSFIATNVATAIAKYGVSKSNGERPKVAIIEGDLQSLSVGTLLQIENPTYNLRTALLEVSRVVNKDGELIGNPIEQHEVEQRVLDCFIKYHKMSNLYALVGSELSLRDLHDINSYQYYYLISILVKHFDVIIVDTNSSLEHITTGPLLELAKVCYYILDLDYNNIRNNIRYRKDLEELCEGKIRYILNRDMTREIEAKYSEQLKYTSADLEANGFELDAKIPMVDLSVMYNRVYEGTPLILDETPATEKARSEILKIAGNIVPLQEMKKKGKFFHAK